MMKAIRIILFVLIIIGIFLLCTQRFWVPKLVDRILLLENPPIVKQEVVTLKDGRQCYTYNHEETDGEPYTVNEFIDININGKIVTGTKRGTQSGPDMTNGYTGSIDGILNDDTITAVYSYVVEGSSNKEKEIYRASETGIEKLRYPLVEEGKILVPDKTKEFKILQYDRVGCIASN